MWGELTGRYVVEQLGAYHQAEVARIINRAASGLEEFARPRFLTAVPETENEKRSAVRARTGLPSESLILMEGCTSFTTTNSRSTPRRGQASPERS